MNKKYIVAAAAALTLIALIIFLSPVTSWLNDPASKETGSSADEITIESAEQLTITQGKNDVFFSLTNETDTVFDFQVQLPPVGLSLEPREGTLAPGASRDIILHVDDLYPTGKLSSMAYLLIEAAGENPSMDTLDLHLRVEPGELRLEIIDDKITALWNDAAALPGTTIYFRLPDYAREKWLKWYEIPRLETTPFFYTETHSLQFIAQFGDRTSSIYNYDLTIKGLDMPAEPPIFSQVQEKAARLYLMYIAGTDNPETLEQMGYTEDMEYMDILLLIRQLDSSGYNKFMELKEYLEVMDIHAYIEHLIVLNEKKQEE